MVALALELPETNWQVSKAIRGNAERLSGLARPLAVARALADQLNYRVFRLGEPAQPFPGYKGNAVETVEVRDRRGRVYQATRRVKGPDNQQRRGYKVSPAYARATLGSDDQVWFDSSKDFHEQAHVVPGTYTATGGMAAGLQSRNFGTNAAIIEFAGSSLGSKSTRTALTQRDGEAAVERYKDANGRWRYRGKKLRRDDQGNVKYRSKPVMIRNWIKAGTIFKHHRVCVLQHTDTETYDLCDALADHMRLTWLQVLPGNTPESVSYQGAQGHYYRLLLKYMGIG